ncbi:hypothetical protein Cpap_1488 [Ruminiclostridium papyrosolvens DSM 2782]|uniref:Radical SAM domain protein n=1 Tax=Ruminiclostridium papyrosolvens DSM 2782 TaxID=588581 RepID=F1TED0_9FIRM|nr:hypothetical protein [Ruminiclostridium papyrosolvens]EGD47096.1 hypothetical protein Cpap_1488 [Ruminiclostridium papyrosolvens DSM 2782]WES36039.1 hypothetical protein P0092_08775 [Ruminiclostridium papyrosolvens DSM 2782]WES36137.1 hypothetical protein P0092_09275 [Ruminiclostridium papyrosolvens DSM 2782]
MNVAIADADLIANVNHRFPNSCCMRISGYHLGLGDTTELITEWKQVHKFDKVYISKVFTGTIVPDEILNLPNVVYGGTGFYYPKTAPRLPPEIEHHMPDYNLYSEWVKRMIDKGYKKSEFFFYTSCSIGKLTDGCFMGCSFCVNKDCTKVRFNAHIEEFHNKDYGVFIFLDDQFLGYKDWEPLLDEVIKTGKPFQFKQGLDIRLMTDKKAEKLTNANYYKDFIFAFDNINDEPIIREKLALWRKYTQKRTKLYTFCGYEEKRNKLQEYETEFWVKDLNSVFKRIFILAEYDCVPYIMRHLDYKLSPFSAIYNEIASWCNQPWALRTMTYRQFCIGRGMGKRYKQYKHDPERYLQDGHKKGSSWVQMEKFEQMYPEIAAKYFDKKYSDACMKAA